ncbi:Cyclic nucleotide-monophosphate binding domain [Teratosphaeria destructans]|uniref:Cyclic nucleotide-monophosphate binding domain n=1 Tax=Teratosphaeria destructans TaxID=418781 RepID=A0A9W7SZD4_9PEZI|nr:Cyclic nucleotide-monophosphate binding domain [Teratosphaeria destructans]
MPEVVVTDDEYESEPAESAPLLPRSRLSTHRKQIYDTAPRTEDQEDTPNPGTWNRLGHHYPSVKNLRSRVEHAANPKTWDFRKLGYRVVLEPVSMLPAVFLGLLLNLLDALSYGIILFPLGEEVFSDLGADGVSMFYVSCIIAQLTYSTGSIFRGGVGSEMIEVVPFFHKMTYMIMARMGTEEPDALRATVITSYAMSSIITGIVFFALGSARLGTLVNFFPHSILTGCIGGVGIFLFLTGVEVSARLDGSVELTLALAQKLFRADTVPLWIPPLALAIILMVIRHYYDRPWLVPAYYIAITAIFYVVTAAVPAITMDKLRDAGWVFAAPAAGVPFYNFYSHYKFGLVDWRAIWMTIPSQLALTFFGILHVPINVPNLAMVVQEDNVSINRELIMHGISNTLSGCVGSIQNYLVFVNSVLVINTGGDSRLAGYMLAAATFGLWVAGPIVIGYVPVMVVGTLIYQLGIELTMEALVSTYGKLYRLEYITIVIIAVVMGVYDFVVGIAIGIGLACLVYVVQTSRKTVIRAEFSGAVAESTVRRHPRQRNYLHKAGSQIRVVKLGGFLFFGSIVKVEKKVRSLIDAEAFAAKPIRYLIVDFSHVTGIDFSAAEAFVRMNRILHRRQVKMDIAGVSLGSDVGRSLHMVGLFMEDEDSSVPAPKVFENLNGALESCENELLLVLAEKQTLGMHRPEDSPPMMIHEAAHLNPSPLDNMIGSPRRNHLVHAATTAITETREPVQSKWQNLKQPLPLLLQAFQGLTDKNEDFWFRAVPYFTRRHFTKGQMLYTRGDKPDGFYLLQSGILRAEYDLDQGSYHESIVAGTTCGELPFFSETDRTGSVLAEQDCVAWLLTPEKWERLQGADAEVAKELLKVGLKLSAERMNAITSYVLITAS